jgi:phosphoglycerate dehydrogenase-like enzyme
MHDTFRVGLSADFRLEDGSLMAPDLGLSLLEGKPGLAFEFLGRYEPEYAPDQFAPYDAVISLKPRVTRRSLEGARRLVSIGRCGVGYDNVDLKACTDADVAVYITPQAVVRPVAESVVLLLLALSHGLVRKDRMVRSGLWKDSLFPLGREPRGRVVGLIGLGRIGSEIVELLRPFGPATVLVHDPFVSADTAGKKGVELAPSLEDLLERSDYVIVMCPLNEQTRGLVGRAELARMRPHAYLINAARGPIVDQTALTEALRERRIAGAALDVFEREPLDDANHPLMQLDNVILTSHSIGWTEELFRDMGRCDCEGALAVFEGRAPENVVNPEVLSRPGFLRKLEQRREIFAAAEASR